MRNNQRFAAAVGCLVLAVLLISGGILARSLYCSEETGDFVTAPAAPLRSETPYTLRGYDGVICVFSDGDVPVLSTDIVVATLRSTDRALLEQGIRANSYEEVIRLLEDFDS